MTIPTPDAPRVPPPQGNAPVVLRTILAILLGIPGIIGLVVFATLVGEWLQEGFQFKQSDLWLMPLFLIGAESCICFSVLTIGVVLRFARWKRAPMASLVLVVLTAAVIVLGYQLMLDCLQPDDTEDRQLALVFAVIGLIVVAVPPFLHWWKANRVIDTQAH
jgi:hypothetical protein